MHLLTKCGVLITSTKISFGKNPLKVCIFITSIFLKGLYEVDVGLRLNQSDNIMVFADLNNDKYTDIVTVNDART